MYGCAQPQLFLVPTAGVFVGWIADGWRGFLLLRDPPNDVGRGTRESGCWWESIQVRGGRFVGGSFGKKMQGGWGKPPASSGGWICRSGGSLDKR